MRVLRTIRTPWAPYSVMFSRDGTRLAVGGGSWYGGGGILLADLSSEEITLFACAGLPRSPGPPEGPPTVSGVCFSADDRHLVASAWGSSLHNSPTHLFEVSGLRLTHSVQLVQPYEAIIGSPCPTGVLLHRDWTVVRSIAAQIRDVLAAWETPRQLQVNTEALPHHLSSSRLVVVRGMAITGDGGLGLSAWREDLAGGERGRPTDVLVALRPGADPSEAEALPVRDCHAVTAIGMRPPDDAFFTGGLDGEMDAWSWEGRWVQHRLRGRTKRRQPRFPDLTDLTWATYNPNSIVGICSLADGGHWASVSAGGEVCLWDGPTLTRSWQLPETGSPRSLAAHPDRPLLAVGIKKGGFARPESAVLLAEVEQVTLDPAWRTPAVLALAQAPDRERISTGGALDPAHLAVLADALEEAGCTDGRALRHLRGHAPHLRGCWVVDQVMGKE